MNKWKKNNNPERKSLPASHWTKDLYPEYIKSSKKLNSKKTNNPTSKWANELNRQFSEAHMANKQMKCSISLVIKKLQIKMTLRFHFTSVRMVIIRKTNKKCRKGCGKK
jgi:hypothetical protein